MIAFRYVDVGGGIIGRILSKYPPSESVYCPAVHYHWRIFSGNTTGEVWGSSLARLKRGSRSCDGFRGVLEPICDAACTSMIEGSRNVSLRFNLVILKQRSLANIYKG